MSTADDLLRSLKDLVSRLAANGRRTAAITRLRMELTGLDRQRKELHSKLGAHVDELRRSGQLVDGGVLRLLELDFERIDRMEKSIRDTLEQIQQINLEEPVWEDVTQETGHEPAPRSGDLLNSFEVL
jgi:hypothetical protein